jgi:hypothetical protein
MLSLACGGCQSSGPARPALISHLVFITLNDPAEADSLIAECDTRLASIPGVVSYACGRHIDTGRPTVDANYDVGLSIGFDSLDAYSTYVDHPNHTTLVAEWRDRIKTMMVRDVLDATD